MPKVIRVKVMVIHSNPIHSQVDTLVTFLSVSVPPQKESLAGRWVASRIADWAKRKSSKVHAIMMPADVMEFLINLLGPIGADIAAGDAWEKAEEL